MSSTSPTHDAVTRYFAAIAARDADAWAAGFAPDGTAEDPVGSGVTTGAGPLREFQQSIFDAFPVMELTARDVVVCGAEAAVHWTCHVDDGNCATDFSGVNTYLVDEDGAILVQRAYWDLAAVQAALATGRGKR